MSQRMLVCRAVHAAFRQSLSPPPPLTSLVAYQRSISPLRPCAVSRRNIFVEPPSRKDEELKELYPPGRFNSEEDEDERPPAQLSVPQQRIRHAQTPLEVSTVGPAAHSRVKSATFVKSSVTVDQCPHATHPEFAVIGRSNVGKSSLINMLTKRTSLAMVSKTPGKTRCINHFLINNSWYLVDLPGYGYAKTSKANVKLWNDFTREYFVNRETLVAVLLLVDASIPPRDLDVEAAAWFASADVRAVL
ncbi:ENGB1 [Auxenochlorella protothecoides x Auxenochlorella symbiontica]